MLIIYCKLFINFRLKYAMNGRELLKSDGLLLLTSFQFVDDCYSI